MIKALVIYVFIFLSAGEIALASSQVSVTAYPANNIAGQEFEVTFGAVEIQPNSFYSIKALGGENFTKVDTWNSGWYQQNASWSVMPQFISNSEGSVSGTIKAKFDATTLSGIQEFKIRIRKTDNETNIDSNVVNINVSVPTASPSPAPTQKPSTPAPTSIPAVTTAPTQKPTKSPTLIPAPIKTPTVSPKVLAVSDEILSETSEVKTAGQIKKPFNTFLILSIGIIFIGIIFVGVAGFMAYRMRYNNSNEQKD